MTYMEGMVYKEVDKEVNKEADKEVNKEVDEYEAYAVNKVDKEVNKVVDEYEANAVDQELNDGLELEDVVMVEMEGDGDGGDGGVQLCGGGWPHHGGLAEAVEQPRAYDK